MNRSIFRTPIVSLLCHYIARFFMWVRGWKVVGEAPTATKYVLIAAPHTSNYDFPVMIGAVFTLRMDVHWMGKSSLFQFPLGMISRWFGGISIDRNKASNTVDSTVEVFEQRDELVVVIPPEGTRAKVARWKSGFYHIANQADVPIVLGFVDTATKTVGFGKVFIPTGDIDKDMIDIQAFYKDKKGFN